MSYKHFTLYDAEGTIISTYSMPASSPIDEFISLQKNPPGISMIEAESDILSDAIDIVTKKVIKGGKKKPEKNYIQNRSEAYPTVQEQLDMLWHGMDTNQIPKSEPFYSIIKQVKESYPKDNSTPGNSVRVIKI